MPLPYARGNSGSLRNVLIQAMLQQRGGGTQSYWPDRLAMQREELEFKKARERSLEEMRTERQNLQEFLANQKVSQQAQQAMLKQAELDQKMVEAGKRVEPQMKKAGLEAERQVQGQQSQPNVAAFLAGNRLTREQEAKRAEEELAAARRAETTPELEKRVDFFSDPVAMFEDVMRPENEDELIRGVRTSRERLAVAEEMQRAEEERTRQKQALEREKAALMSQRVDNAESWRASRELIDAKELLLRQISDFDKQMAARVSNVEDITAVDEAIGATKNDRIAAARLERDRSVANKIRDYQSLAARSGNPERMLSEDDVRRSVMDARMQNDLVEFTRELAGKKAGRGTISMSGGGSKRQTKITPPKVEAPPTTIGTSDVAAAAAELEAENPGIGDLDLARLLRERKAMPAGLVRQYIESRK